MKGKRMMVVLQKRNYCKEAVKYSIGVLICLAAMFYAFAIVQAQEEWPHVVASKDGTPISYEVYGAGEPTLVFVHGWSCDARYWREQLSYFSKKHRVVMLDLAGHGHSGSTRSKYTMKAFGEDVQAVTEAINSRSVILIGHSMGGSVIAEAARLMPDRVKGIIGVDTLDNIEYLLTREDLDQMLAPLKSDFKAGSKEFIKQMIASDMDPLMREWILADVSSAPPAVAVSAMNEMMSQYITGDAARIFEEIRIPVIVVNGDLYPIDFEANRRHMFSFDATVLEKADHFLMMDRAEKFNQALSRAIEMISQKKAK
jgi:pimeloyl-ACP methyl ester carboxylesterase